MAKDTPHFWLMGFCFLWFLIQSKSNGSHFDVIALGHSGLLISWDPHKVQGEFDTTYLVFICRAMPEESKNTTSDKISVEQSQYQISKLNENTHYRINITQYDNFDDSVINEYYIDEKTGLQTNSSPPKPDFTWVLIKADPLYNIRIIWFPCGKYRKCNESLPTTHFSIIYKAMESKHCFESGDIYNGYYEIRNIHIFTGKIYELTVISINGGLKTASDTEEVFIRPTSSPVRDVEVVQLSNMSLLMIWKPPLNQLYPVTGYVVTYTKLDHTLKIEDVSMNNKDVQINRLETQNRKYNQIKISYLEPATEYKIFIIPETTSLDSNQFFFGIEYSVNYILRAQSSKLNLPLATPDFTFWGSAELDNPYLCRSVIHWLPCGKDIKPCENTRPGSTFKLQLKYKITGEITLDRKMKSTHSGEAVIEMNKTGIYEVTVQSIDGSEVSKMVTKTFDSSICKDNDEE